MKIVCINGSPKPSGSSSGVILKELKNLLKGLDIKEISVRKPELTEEMKAARETWNKRWEEYSPARQEQFRIKENKARRESKLNTEFAKKLRDEYK